MSEPMREYTKEIDLRPLADRYPSARKVTVDMAGRTAYVFTCSGHRAMTITGAEFDALVKALPGKEGQDDAAEVEPVEAVISVVKEPEPDVQEAAPKKRGK